MKTLSWVNVLLGVWLVAAAAFLFSAAPASVTASESVAGITIAVLSYTAAVALRPSPVISWCVAAAGLWLLVVSYGIVAPPSHDAMVVGTIVVILGSTNGIYRHMHAHR